MKISLLTGFIAGVGVSMAVYKSKVFKALKSSKAKTVVDEVMQEIIDEQ